jgi:hypothetical protein
MQRNRNVERRPHAGQAGAQSGFLIIRLGFLADDRHAAKVAVVAIHGNRVWKIHADRFHSAMTSFSSAAVDSSPRFFFTIAMYDFRWSKVGREQTCLASHFARCSSV